MLAFDSTDVGSLLSLRSLAHTGLAPLIFGLTWADFSLPMFDSAALGSSLLPRSFAELELVFFAFGVG